MKVYLSTKTRSNLCIYLNKLNCKRTFLGNQFLRGGSVLVVVAVAILLARFKSQNAAILVVQRSTTMYIRVVCMLGHLKRFAVVSCGKFVQLDHFQLGGY